MEILAPPRVTSRTPSRARPHAVVIGSGFGGLAAAVRLGARGYRVTVLERLDGPGGRGYVHRQGGLALAAGPPVRTPPLPPAEAWRARGPAPPPRLARRAGPPLLP